MSNVYISVITKIRQFFYYYTESKNLEYMLYENNIFSSVCLIRLKIILNIIVDFYI